MCNRALTSCVRKELAVALKDLLQHGLMEVGQSTSLVPLGCFPARSRAAHTPKMMHAWDLFVRYYDMKVSKHSSQYVIASFFFIRPCIFRAQHGKEYNETAQRKLTQSFGLEIVGGKAVTVKEVKIHNTMTVLHACTISSCIQTLLGGVAEILASHVPLKRSEDSQFKAFVCYALKFVITRLCRISSELSQ